MEEKANKLGKSWKQPGKKIKLVSRLSQSEVKDLKQEGTYLISSHFGLKKHLNFFKDVFRIQGQKSLQNS